MKPLNLGVILKIVAIVLFVLCGLGIGPGSLMCFGLAVGTLSMIV